MDEATTDQVADLHQKVRASIDEEDLDGAAALILEAREQGVLRDLDGASFGGWVRILGEIAWREGRPKRAARLVTGALGIQGDGASLQELGHSWLLLAHIQYEGRGRRRRARQSAQRAVRLLDAARDPAVIEANQLLGDILLDTGHERKAARSFGLALDGMEAFEVVDRTQRYELLNGLAEALEAIGDIEAACTARTRQISS
jgi:tetratricopeptide (TPR) repeat protein